MEGNARIKINMPENVKKIIAVLERNGYEAYAVGGCIRDALLGRKPSDWDITTSAMPQEVKQLFRRTVDTGIKHGTVTIMIGKEGYEVTTYRIDGEYEDGRHPRQVAFTGNLIEDIKRRDFTINAMAYNEREGLVDAFEGAKDLQNGIIRCVGNPTDRFNEDALRILRAVRFCAALGFSLEENTKTAISQLAGNLQKISKERIQAELEKLLLSDHPEQLRTACELGITSVVLEEIDRLEAEALLEQVLAFVGATQKEHYLRWSALLSAAGKERAAVILKELKFDNKTIRTVSRLVGALERQLPVSRAALRREIYELGEDIYEQYLAFLEIYYRDDETKLEQIRWQKKTYRDILAKGECISLKMLAVNGKDLIEAGFSRGEQVGEKLKRLLYLVLEDSSLNDKAILMEKLKESSTGIFK